MHSSQDASDIVADRRSAYVSQHDSGCFGEAKLAKKNLATLKSSKGRNIDSIKKEVVLSLEELENMSKNSIDEMNEFVKSYNLDL